MAKKQKKKKKLLYWGLMLVLFIAAAVIVYFVCKAIFRDEKRGALPETGQLQVVEMNDDIVQDLDVDEVTEKPKVVQYDGDDPNMMEELSGAVTRAEVMGGNLVIRVNIDQYLQDGTCDLIIIKDGEIVYNDMAMVVGGATTATCEGFDIPVEDLGTGLFEIEINVSGEGKVGTMRGGASI